MICYLASSPAHLGNTRLDPANGFVENLKRDLPRDINMVFVASDPDDHAGMEGYADEMRRCFEKAGYRVIRVQLAYDGRMRRYYKLTL